AEAYTYHAQFVERNAEAYQPETLQRIRAGKDVGIPAYIEALRGVELVRRTLGKVFETVDVIVTPTTAVPPSLLADVTKNVNASMTLGARTMRNTSPFNVTGWPAISIPCGFTRAEMPIGLQLSGPPAEDAVVLRLAHAYEQATNWHARGLP